MYTELNVGIEMGGREGTSLWGQEQWKIRKGGKERGEAKICLISEEQWTREQEWVEFIS